MDITLATMLAAGISALAGAFTALLKNYRDVRALREKQESLKDATKRVTEFGLSIAGLSFNHTIEHNPNDTKLASELLREIESEIASQASNSQASSSASVRAEIDSKIGELRDRLQAVEDRFPDKSSIDKIASINDALFAERIDQISARIDGLEKKLLSRWDVALTVCLIIAGIFSIVGATYAVLKVFSVLGVTAA